MKHNKTQKTERANHELERHPISTEELCARLGKQRTSIWRYEKRGWIKAVQPKNKNGLKSRVKFWFYEDVLKQLEQAANYESDFYN